MCYDRRGNPDAMLHTCVKLEVSIVVKLSLQTLRTLFRAPWHAARRDRPTTRPTHMQRAQCDRIHYFWPAYHSPVTCTLISMQNSGPDVRQSAGGSYCEGKLCDVSRM